MNTSPEISVIIPAYNAADTIADTIASVQAQTHIDWEMICVDDESTDQTSEVLEALMAHEPRLTVVRVPHGGPGAGRNHGLREARADRVVFLDADDLLAPETLEQMLYASQRAGAQAIIAPGWEYLDQQGQPLHVRRFPSFAGEPFDLLLRGNRLLSVALIPKHLLGHEPFDATLPAVEDWDLWLRLADEGARFVALPRVLVGYRLQRSSRSHRIQRRFNAGCQLLDTWIPFARGAEPVADLHHRWACTCGALGLAHGEPQLLNRFLATLPPLVPASDFPLSVAYGVDWAFLVTFGPLGQTWRGHMQRWSDQIAQWLRDSVLAPWQAEILDKLHHVALDPIEEVDRVCEFVQASPTRTRLLIYGLGTNGLGLLEELRSDQRLREIELLIADDYAENSIAEVLGLSRVDPRKWTHWPDDTLALVTANNDAGMCQTLIQAGGEECIDFVSLQRIPAATIG